MTINTNTYQAVVVDNKDPSTIGRLRVRSEQLHTGVADADLPWISSKYMPSIEDKHSGLELVGTFYVPKIGDIVTLEYINGDDDYMLMYSNKDTLPVIPSAAGEYVNSIILGDPNVTAQ